MFAKKDFPPIRQDRWLEGYGRFLLGILWLLAGTAKVEAQYNAAEIDPPVLSRFVAPSPEAASLGKYGHIPVNLYTGIPDISIPLFTMTSRQLELPMSLSYHGGGIRVEEMASRIGLGWSLLAGGAITRTVRGPKDEASNMEFGYLSVAPDMDLANPTAAPYNLYNNSLLRQVATGVLDGQPDAFAFNVMGHSGTFSLDRDTMIHVGNGDQVLQFSPEFINDDIVAWELVDGDGTRYVFREYEEVSSRQITYDATPSSGSGGGSVPGMKRYMITAWYLTKVVTANRTDSLVFEYEDFTPSPSVINETFYAHDHHLLAEDEGTVQCTDQANDGSATQTTETAYCGDYSVYIRNVNEMQVGKRLDRILAQGQWVDFIYGAGRADFPGDHALAEVRRYVGDIWVESVELFHGYFQTDHPDPDDPTMNKRLRLDSVRQVGVQDGQWATAQPATYLEYREGAGEGWLPPRNSVAQDHWGFFNGEYTNSSLMPELFVEELGMMLPGADREPSEQHMKIGTLKRITFPTGGWSEFTFEPHDYSWIGSTWLKEPQYAQHSASAATAKAGKEETYTCNGLLKNKEVVSTWFSLADSQWVEVHIRLKKACLPTHKWRPAAGVYDSKGKIVFEHRASGDAEEWENLSPRIKLGPGSYELRAENHFSGDEASIGLLYRVPVLQNGQQVFTRERMAGGLRVAEIATHDGWGGAVGREVFEYRLEDSLSSGELVSPIKYSYPSRNIWHLTCDLWEFELDSDELDCRYTSRATHSQIPIGLTQGSHVGYRQVTRRKLDENGNDRGKTVTDFISCQNYADGGLLEYPYLANTSMDWARGNMKAQYILNAVGDTVQVDQYYHTGVLVHTIPGLLADMWEEVLTAGLYDLSQYEFKRFERQSGWMRLDSMKVLRYGEGNSPAHTQAFRYLYNDLHQRTGTVMVGIDGEEQVEEQFRAGDFASGQNPVIDTMQARNMLNPVIEKVGLVGNSGQLELAGGEYHAYGYWPEVGLEGAILPQEVLAFSVADPVDESSFVRSVNGVGLLPDTSFYESRLLYEAFDFHGNLLGQQADFTASESYLWGYGQRLPIGKVVGASADEVAYTGFDGWVLGNWDVTYLPTCRTTWAGCVQGAGSASDRAACDQARWECLSLAGSLPTLSTDARAGEYAYVWSNNLQLDLGTMPPGTYQLGFYHKLGTPSISISGGNIIGSPTVDGPDAQGWTFRSYLVELTGSNNGVSISGPAGSLIDELRWMPEGAQLTSLSYDARNLVHTVTDANGFCTYYQYDELGRIRYVIDDNGDFRLGYDYHLTH
ncbi:RHS repeat domain-containing protein [Pontibacter sp. G13]|uniref:RHS repeat domain-containing protein n=1 Tax=Pontibacter sp. G13 TaxID=3074898 RepID=UPI00288C2F22|nr:RHS repeat domain-containing protein [Pontibacter sp. G13]WNJ21631.1 RHS repeat domain-containing protein [Pontibacter sp. G13]